jgi:hypothetical protein
MKGVNSYIQQLTDNDPDAQAFRYAVSKKGAASLPPNITHINIRVFADSMERLADFLDGLDAAFGGLQDNKRNAR